jgi:hypothetical protein
VNFATRSTNSIGGRAFSSMRMRLKKWQASLQRATS